MASCKTDNCGCSSAALAPPAALADLLDRAAVLLAPLGLELQRDKCGCWLPRGTPVPAGLAAVRRLAVPEVLRVGA